MTDTSAHPPNPYGIKGGDLISPDGERVWVVAGGDLKMHCWTIKDFQESRPANKILPTADPSRYTPLTSVNRSPKLVEAFIADYMAVNHGVGQHTWRFGLQPPPNWSDAIGQKVYCYAGGVRQSTEHVITDYNDYYRCLTVRDRSNDLLNIDTWEVTASWHWAWGVEPDCPTAVPPTTSTDDQYLYRLYNKGGALLYVGITNNYLRRWNQHAKEKSWWPEVHNFTQDWFPDRASVEAAERHAITVEQPRYNTMHAGARVDA